MSYTPTKKFVLAILLAMGSLNVHGMEEPLDGAGEESSEERKQEDDYSIWWKMPRSSSKWDGKIADYKEWWKGPGHNLFDHEVIDEVPIPSLKAIFDGIKICDKNITMMLILNRGDFLRSKNRGDEDIVTTIANLTKFHQNLKQYGEGNIINCIYIQKKLLPNLQKLLIEPFKASLMENSLVNFKNTDLTVTNAAFEDLLNGILTKKILYIQNYEDFEEIFTIKKLKKNFGNVKKEIEECVKSVYTINYKINKSIPAGSLLKVHASTKSLIEMIDKVMATSTARSIGLTEEHLMRFIGLQDRHEGQ